LLFLAGSKKRESRDKRQNANFFIVRLDPDGSSLFEGNCVVAASATTESIMPRQCSRRRGS
jgi:hypothetical protein